jgi:hypothetical protein
VSCGRLVHLGHIIGQESQDDDVDRIHPGRYPQPAPQPEASGPAILFITRGLSPGSYVSDRTVILRRGAIVEMGGTVKVFGDPQHSYPGNLLAAVPELRKKWHPAAAARSLTRAERPERPIGALALPPLTQFGEDYFVAAAGS